MSRLTRFVRRAQVTVPRPQTLWFRLLGRPIPLRVAIISMMKNEGSLVRLWFSYHARIFGAENIFIFDNGSTDRKMIDALRDAEEAGATVNYSFNRPEDFGRKGAIVSTQINRLMPRYDFLVPLDGDEFLTMPGEDLLDPSGKPIFRHLSELVSRKEQFFRIGTALRNHPGTPFGSPVWAKKAIIKRGPPVSLSDGFHLYDFSKKVDLVPSENITPSKLIHVHFAFKDFEGMVQSAREKLKLWAPDFTEAAMKRTVRKNNHVRRFLTMSPEEYYAVEAPGPNAIDLSNVFRNRALGDVPFGQPVIPSAERLRQLQDPINPFYIASID
jgi:hypothetical protein